MSPDDIGNKIEKLTECLLAARGAGASFESEHSIMIELSSPDVEDLSLIDLPGIVRTHVAGQHTDVKDQVQAMGRVG